MSVELWRIKKVFSFRWSKNSSAYLEIPSISHMLCISLLAPLLLGAHGFFFSLAELFATESPPFWRSFFSVFLHAKKERQVSLSLFPLPFKLPLFLPL